MQEKPIFPKLGFIANFLYYYCSVEAPHSLHLLLECLCKIEEDTLDTEIKQNHRSRALLSLDGTSEYHLVQIPCSKQGQLEQVAQGHVHSSLEYVHRRRLYNCSGQAVPTLTHPHSKKKKKTNVYTLTRSLWSFSKLNNPSSLSLHHMRDAPVP